MTPPEFQEYQPVEPANVAAEVAALLDTPDDPERRPARPHEVNPAVSDYQNGIEDAPLSDTARAHFVGVEHKSILDKLRGQVAAAQVSVEEIDPDDDMCQKRLESHVDAVQKAQPSGVTRATRPKDTI